MHRLSQLARWLLLSVFAALSLGGTGLHLLPGCHHSLSACHHGLTACRHGMGHSPALLSQLHNGHSDCCHDHPAPPGWRTSAIEHHSACPLCSYLAQPQVERLAGDDPAPVCSVSQQPRAEATVPPQARFELCRPRGPPASTVRV